MVSHLCDLLTIISSYNHHNSLTDQETLVVGPDMDACSVVRTALGHGPMVHEKNIFSKVQMSIENFALLRPGAGLRGGEGQTPPPPRRRPQKFFCRPTL